MNQAQKRAEKREEKRDQTRRTGFLKVLCSFIFIPGLHECLVFFFAVIIFHRRVKNQRKIKLDGKVNWTTTY